VVVSFVGGGNRNTRRKQPTYTRRLYEFTSNMSGVVQKTGTSSSPVFSGVRVTQSLVLFVCFVDRCLSFCPFFFWPLCCLSFELWMFCFCFFLINVQVLCIECTTLPISLDCPFLIVPSVFSNAA
jgi:hypothetical protein